ncbi:hypothetical protein ACFWNQ_24865 [Streptomyces virginiae]|uniref:hypothetical protein n=1 Tax=Streptomyces virginiae TaxID=1961 RepID=UPI00364C8D5D
MPVSGRRHQALKADYTQLLKDNAQLLVELREVTSERDAAREVVAGLAQRNRELIGRPLTGGEQVLAKQLRASEEARAHLVEQIDTLQTANEAMTRDAYDAAKAARQVSA